MDKVDTWLFFFEDSSLVYSKIQKYSQISFMHYFNKIQKNSELYF